MKYKIKMQNFYQGGLADSPFVSANNKFQFSVGLDLYKRIGAVNINQRLIAITPTAGNEIDQSLTTHIACSNGKSYLFGESGKVWELSASNVVTLVYTIIPTSGSAKIFDAIEYEGYIYFITQNYLHRIRVTKTSNWSTGVEANWQEIHLDQEMLGSTGQTYTVPTAITENAVNTFNFRILESVTTGIAVKIINKGTGNWTLTIHDSANNVVGTKVINNVSLVNSSFNIFTFAPELNLDIETQYHYHLTSSVADGTVDTGVVSDLSKALTKIYSKGDPDFHQFTVNNLVLYFADRNYIHQVDVSKVEGSMGQHIPTLFALDVPKPLRITDIESEQTFILIGTYIANNVNKTQLIAWDTYSESFTYSDPIEETGIYAIMKGDRGVFVSAGLSGNIYKFTNNSLNLDEGKRLPGNFDKDNYGYVLPNAKANYKGRLLFGFSTIVGDPIYNGVYSLGATANYLPNVINLEYAISARNGGNLVLNQIQITSILVRGFDLFVTWKRLDTNTVGLDVISWTLKHDQAMFKSGVISIDEGIYEMKVRQLKVDYISLPTNTNVEILTYANLTNTPQLQSSNIDSDKKHIQSFTSFPCTRLEVALKFITDANNAPEVFGLFMGID